MADITDDEIAGFGWPSARDGHQGELEQALRTALAASAGEDDGVTCCELYCGAERPPAGLEAAYGWYAVGGLVFCPMHGYGHHLKARRQAQRDEWERRRNGGR